MSATPPPGGRAAPDDGGLVLFRIAGVPVLLSPSWWLGATLIVLLYTPLVDSLLPDAGILTSAFLAAGLTALLAVSVLFHELGHCVIAMRFGLSVRRVRLFLLGGISEITRTPPKPAHEGLIAAAGPAVSAGLAATTGLGWFALAPGGAVWLLVAQTCLANVAVTVFNLLPGLPLDGGRIVRALTWTISGHRHIGTTAGILGAGGVAVALLAWACVGLARDTPDQWLRSSLCVLMAWFVIAGAGAEHSAEQRKHVPEGLSLRRLMRPVLQLPAESFVSDALVASAGRGVVLVRADGVAVGLLDRTAAERLAASTPCEPAERAAEPVGPDTILAESDSTETLVERARTIPAREFLVVNSDGRPCGVLRREDMGSDFRWASRRS